MNHSVKYLFGRVRWDPNACPRCGIWSKACLGGMGWWVTLR